MLILEVPRFSRPQLVNYDFSRALGAIRPVKKRNDLTIRSAVMEKFFNDVQKPKDKPSSAPADQQDPEAQPKKAIPKGVVLGKDGKP